jgi:ribosomal protein L35AE/L33A
VLSCLHSDFRIGGLAPGETRHIRGKVYVVDATTEALRARFERDFPEQARRK